MDLNYELTADDVVQAHRTHIRKALGTTSRSVLVGFGFLVLLCMFGCVSWLLRRPREMVLEMWPFAAIITLSVIYCSYIWSGTFRRRQFRKDRALQLPVHMLVGSEEITFTNLRGQSTTVWSALEDWRESKNTFLLYPRPNMYYIVPKRAMQVDEIAAFRAMLENRIPKGR